VETWLSCKSVLGTWHLAKAVFALSVLLRADTHQAVVAAGVALDAAAWAACTWRQQRASYASHKRLQAVAFVCNVAVWALRTMVRTHTPGQQLAAATGVKDKEPRPEP
jgi:thiol:disulfide interchange protein